MTEITLNTLKLHNERLTDFINELEDTFKWTPIHPKMSSEEVMYRAGQASVLDYIKSKMEE
tara:strand:+ start:240 stop:422 length:183 start_codon:yes stop_codon:yes gene_type:complete